MSKSEANWALEILLIGGNCPYTAQELVDMRKQYVARLEINGEYNGSEFAPNSKSKG